MALNATKRGRLGAVITEATIIKERRNVYQARAQAFQFDRIDDDEPAESPVPDWDDPSNKLNKALLWEIVGPAMSPVGTDAQMRDHLLRELENRLAVWDLMKDAVEAVQTGNTTPFMTTPVAAAIAKGCRNNMGNDIDHFELMRIMHMFGDKHTPSAPRPIDPIIGNYFFTTEAEVVVEIGRRVRELAAGILWEGKVKGGKEKKKAGVWNRYGLYCGCG